MIPSNHPRTRLRWCPALLFALIIFGFSSMQGDEVEESYRRLRTFGQSTPTPTATQAILKLTATKTPAPRVTVTMTAAGQKATSTPTPPPPARFVFPKLDYLKVGHVIGYFWLGLTVLYALGLQTRWSPVQAVIICALYAVSDEFHQTFSPGRTASARDVLLDTLAALGGVLIFIILLKIRASFKKRHQA